MGITFKKKSKDSGVSSPSAVKAEVPKPGHHKIGDSVLLVENPSGKSLVNLNDIVGLIEITDKDGGNVVDVQSLGKVVSTGYTANVGMKGATTINVGNYNSVKLEVSLHMPVPLSDITNKESVVLDLNEAFQGVSEWVDAQMNILVSDYKSDGVVSSKKGK
jgi:hypothetical protein